MNEKPVGLVVWRMIKHFLALFSLGLVACQSSSDPTAVSHSVNVEMLRAKQVTIYPISINGAVPPGDSLERGLDLLRSYCQGEVVLKEIEGIEVEGASDGPIGEPVVRHPDVEPGPTNLVLVFVPQVTTVGRGLYSRYTDGHQQIIFDVEGISEMTMPFFGEEKAWRTVIAHEVGHAMGVPAKADHKWSDEHCTSPNCLMYPRLDTRSVLRSIVELGPPDGFCRHCDQELKAESVGEMAK